MSDSEQQTDGSAGESPDRQKEKGRKDHPFAARRRARKRALQAIYQWQITSDEPVDVIRQFRENQDFSPVDGDYFDELVTQVSEQARSLDDALAIYVDRPLAQVDMTERAVLRIAIYELIEHPEIPYRVILDEAVELARQFGAEQGHSYVNGVLDKAAGIIRQTEIEADQAD